MEKGTFTDPRDGKVYKTVKIGNQVWMAENLAYNAPGSKCYNNDPANCQKYGRLYDWKTAKKVCPPGWHLPSKEEWQELVDFAGRNGVAGKKSELQKALEVMVRNEIAQKKLKAKRGWKSKYLIISCNGTDEFGFAALPGGKGVSFDCFGNVGNDSLFDGFSNVGNAGYWWVASESKGCFAYSLSMVYDCKIVIFNDLEDISDLCSIRCLQD